MAGGTPFVPTREQLDCVTEWRQRRNRERIATPIVPLLVKRFGVTALEAVAILKAAEQREA